MRFRQQGSNKRSDQGTAEYHGENSERDPQIVHPPKISPPFSPTDMGLSVHPAVDNNGPPWRHNNSAPGNRRSHDHGAAACGDAARANDAARADHGACVHRAQGDEASRQREGDDQMFHGSSPWVES
jgi:hypothetical protein